MRWRLRNAAIWLREKGLNFLVINKVRKIAASLEFDVVHAIDHGPYSTALIDSAVLSGKQLWVSFHDHFSTTNGSADRTMKLWNAANRRLVISEEIGAEYRKLFGNKSFEIITDGVQAGEITPPGIKSEDTPVTIYFAGLLHIAYRPLFEILADALDLLEAKGFVFKLILRGTQFIDFLEKRSFETAYRPLTLDNAELKKELDEAAILYLPIKFTKPDFYLYSLSTKMVGYLGGAGTILYHGPGDSAACKLLKKTSSAICSSALEPNELAASVTELLAHSIEISANAKILAKAKFNLDDMQKRFWQQ